ncbi:alpha-amylase family glycosyl hydrolase [Chryseosolibacter indicus]|uniref:Alpha-amylase n=1 Tax=Chryseosolibacter indicus TaxID=2782351 RepID=A0ABS5VN21_9BACT|nr:alpha-amylase family glycosyl hydrolase [Chryseosolibacter indicus]MBT1702245.1 alpha-amylase [Chryseosolibacter indicus]
MKEKQNHLWWQEGIIYQIYPRSFQDSNGDGVGDLKGIITRLDYIKNLGIDAVWISPIYPSPMADFGYDISDYTGIHPLFGSLADFDVLLKEIHNRGMKLILDLVPNHTSDQHPWFLESRSSRDNPKRNWYIWKDPGPDHSPPNNWLAAFGGSAWEWDEKTQQYYYHAFLKEQPDLNWRNPEVQKAMLNVMKFWLDKGVDGFRVDVMWHMIKDDQFRDNPVNPTYQQHMATYDQLLPVFSTDQPEVHKIVRMMRDLLDQYDERMMIGEIYLPIQKLVTYYGAERKGAHLPFNFQLLTLPWDATQIALAIAEYENALPEHGWPNWVLGNHDQPRVASRLGSEQARVAAMLLLTLRGTPTIYYGDEIGLKDVPIPVEEIQDPQGLNMPDKNLSRDPARTPMQWDASTNAGFSTTKPWLRVDRNYTRQNVEALRNNETSIYNLYAKLIALRKKESSLSVGSYTPVYSDHQMIAYIRKAEGSPAFLIILNLTHRPCYFRQKQTSYTGTIVVSTSPELEGTAVEGTISLSGDEGIIIKLKEN